MKFWLISFTLMVTLLSCNKEKIRSNRLMKGDVWRIEEIVIDGTQKNVFGEWVVSDQDIYKEVPVINWSFEGEGSVFEWQFQQKGKKFQLNYIQLCEECDGEQLSDLDYFTHDISGTYDVVKCNRKRMEFKSSGTIGYNNKEISIKIVRK